MSHRPRTGLTANKTDLADTLALHVSAMRLPRGEREYTGAIPGRKFRLDLAWPNLKIFAEVDGGEFMNGRHNRAAGMASDCEKWNLLSLAGWTGYRFTGTMVRNGQAIKTLEQVFTQHL